MRRYLYRIGCAGSMFLNVLIGGRLYQSVCARVWAYWMYEPNQYPILNRLSYWFIRTMDWFEYDHCARSYVYYGRVRKAR